MITEYINILFFILLSLVLTFILVYLNYILMEQNMDAEKDSTYECGFQPFGVIIEKFDIRYYVVALLFLIFDLELIFILPWIISLNYLTVYGFIFGIIFLFILIIGLYYEWIKEGLEWD